MAKRKRKKSSAQTPIRVWFFIAGLIVIVLAGIAGIKFLETPKGKAYLLDAGVADYYAEVQDSIDVELHRAVRELGLDKNLHIKSRRVTIKDRELVSRLWSTTCPRACSLFQINLALTRAVKRAGGAVRSSREESGGTVLVLEAGTRKYTTHRIEVRQISGAQQPPAVSKSSARPKSPRLALVIDDLGYSRDGVVDGLCDLDLPLTFSIIPELPYSRQCLSRALEAGKQVILHLPMEAEEEESATDVRAVLVSMSRDEIMRLVGEYLNTEPGVIGVNNHQGSLATQDSTVMAAVLAVVGSRNLFFFDSLTSPKSIAYNTAKRLGVPTVRNDMFIDDDTEDQVAVEARIRRLLEIARTRGFAVGIGHPKQWTLDALRSYEQTLRNSDVEIVYLSTLVD